MNRPSCCSHHHQGSQESWMPGSIYETRRRIYDDLGNNILVFCCSCNYSVRYNYCLWLRGHFRWPGVSCGLPNNDVIFQYDNSPIHTVLVRRAWRCTSSFPWPAQLPDLNIVEQMWSVLESRVRGRFSPPSSLQQLEDVLHEQWYSISLETVQSLYESIPRMIQAALLVNGCPNPY